jgi:hypothetical protein
MKKLLVTGLVATVLAASTAFAFSLPATQPVKGTEGPDVRLIKDDQSSRPIRGTEGPDVR